MHYITLGQVLREQIANSIQSSRAVHLKQCEMMAQVSFLRQQLLFLQERLLGA